MDDRLAQALAPVLRDLAACGSVVPEVRDDQWSDVDGQVTAMLHSPGGSAQGVSAMTTEPPAQRIASVADQVQEWAVEELCSVGRPATWPECPEHPDSHPLSAVVRDGGPGWACPRTGRVVSEIGQLPAPPRPRRGRRSRP
jgi:hypothetical protein